MEVLRGEKEINEIASAHEIAPNQLRNWKKEFLTYPYLLRNAVITRANQAWSIDITYIKLRRGFIYLTAIIDWHSKCIVSWELNDTLSTRMVIQALKMADAVATPSDQGSQFTSHEYIDFDFVINNKSKISMDGKVAQLHYLKNWRSMEP